MLYMDAYGISVATGSACATESSEPSHVLKAIGRSDEECFSSIRITMGKHTNKQQLNYALKVITQVVRELRKVKNDNR
jgi:cysteine desulfurase